MRARNKPASRLNSQLKEEMYQCDWLKKKASERQRPNVWKAYKTKKLTVNKKVKKTKKDYYKHQIEGVWWPRTATESSAHFFFVFFIISRLNVKQNENNI